jgi:hypothetical protein
MRQFPCCYEGNDEGKKERDGIWDYYAGFILLVGFTAAERRNFQSFFILISHKQSHFPCKIFCWRNDSSIGDMLFLSQMQLLLIEEA